jgi:hypothetical protein
MVRGVGNQSEGGSHDGISWIAVRVGTDVADRLPVGLGRGVEAVSGVSIGYGALATGDRLRAIAQLR